MSLSIDYYPFGSPMPGRSFTSSSYRYGFNGQEKVDEISGAGNHNAAEYWEYDTRLGRRWNIDPVTKSWRSSYDVFDNSPIWKLDPKGDDDFFNKDGSFSHSTKKGSKIFIVTEKGNVAFSKFGTYDAAHRKALVNIATYYGKMVGVDKVGIMHAENGKTSKMNPAFTVGDKDGDIYLNSREGISKRFDDYNHLMNTIFHEKKHKEGKGNSEYSFDHIDIYLDQMKDKSFDKSNDFDYQSSIAGGAGALLQKAATDELDLTGGLEQTTKFVSEFNKLTKKTGVVFGIQRTGQMTTGDTSDDKVIITTTRIK